MIRATRGQLVDPHALVDGVGELDPAACRTITAGIPRAREQAHVGAPRHAGEAARRRARRAPRRARRAPTGGRGRSRRARTAPPVQASSHGRLLAVGGADDRLERRARRGEVLADAARRARPSNDEPVGDRARPLARLRRGRR